MSVTQEAIVLNSFPNGTAEVVVHRITACGGNCGSCESCLFDNQVRTVAVNSVGAIRGDRVIIESKSAFVFKAVALVYLMPLLLFVIGYFLPKSIGLGEGICVAVSFLFLILGGVFLVLSQRRKKNNFTYEIIRKVST